MSSKRQSPPRVHPLLLSLSEAWKVFKRTDTTSPDLHSISEDDPRVLGSKYYTPASDFPPLDVHFGGKVRDLRMRNHSEAMPQDHPGAYQSVRTLAILCLAMKSSSNFIYVDLANNAAIEDLKKEVAELKSKCKSYESILEAHRKHFLRIEHHLKIVNTEYEGNQYEYSLN